MDMIVRFAMGNFPYTLEAQAIGMALQGSMTVRNGANKQGNLQWFHAFVLSVMAGFAGGWLGFIWMGKPSSMLFNDINMASCILAFWFVNYSPMDIGYRLCNTLPVTIVITSFAQLFRSVAIMRFAGVCYDAFKDAPSAYYPIPVFGPILYATLLGNMGGLVAKGLEGHVMNGMPWPVQNGFFCAGFFHFFVHDKTGPIGQLLRTTCMPLQALLGGLPDREFAALVVSYFMQIMGVLQLPEFLGPNFSPFVLRLPTPLPSAKSSPPPSTPPLTQEPTPARPTPARPTTNTTITETTVVKIEDIQEPEENENGDNHMNGVSKAKKPKKKKNKNKVKTT